MSAEKKIKIIIGKVSLDGHDRGIKLVARFLSNAGMEVIYLGPFNTPEKIVNAAIHEDADVIGLSFLSGEHLTYTPMVADLMKEKGMHDVLLIVGGVFPRQDISILKEMGAGEVFIGGSPMESIIDYIKNNARGIAKGVKN
jgi:methylmalonyl-CoA mutase C-terminal domain/subunit